MQLPIEFLPWVGFILLVVALLALDLGLFQRRVHKISVKEALMWTVFWISLAMIFNAFILISRGATPAMLFTMGYVTEEALSVDNLFVFLIILTYFCVPREYWHKVLFYGIIGVLVFRGLFIGAGIALIMAAHWVLYIFGIILIYTAIKVAFSGEKKVKPEKNPVIRFFKRVLPVTTKYEGGNFFTRKSGRLFATPLFIVLLAIETTDIVFAMDSVPAVIAITQDPFIVYTSNVFAILGLRALFFAISGAMEGVYYLNYGLGFILGFIGVKIFAESDYIGLHIPPQYALCVIVIVLVIAILASYLRARRAGGKKPKIAELVKPVLKSDVAGGLKETKRKGDALPDGNSIKEAKKPGGG